MIITTILTCIAFTLTLPMFPTHAVSQRPSNPPVAQDLQAALFNCSQPSRDQDAIIREAEEGRFTTRRVEFIGNTHTRDMVLRRRIVIGLQEGDLFTRRNVIRSLRNVSKLKIIYPVSLKDVELRLDRSDKTVDVSICVKERESHQKRAS